MKPVVVIILTLCLSGCLVDMLMTTAITADMAAQQASSATGSLNEAELESAQWELQDALEFYYAEKGEYPRTLSALAPTYIDAIPTRPDGEPFGYNPLEGTIYPSDKGPSPEDYFMMEEIKTAINSYGTATGFYPPSLDDLYPSYMTSLPRTSTGEAFGYDNKDGRLTHPQEGQQYVVATETATAQGGERGSQPVKPVNAVGSMTEDDVKDMDSLNKSLDRLGY